METDLAETRDARGKVLALSLKGRTEDALALQAKVGPPAAVKATAEFKALYDLKVSLAKAADEEIASSASSSRTLAIVILLVAIASGLGIALCSRAASSTACA